MGFLKGSQGVVQKAPLLKIQNNFRSTASSNGTVRPIHIHSLASKCLVDPTVFDEGRRIPGLQRPVTGRSSVRCWCLGVVCGLVRCRFSRHFNSRQFSSCPFEGHLFDRPATGRLKCHFSFAQHVKFINSIKGFIFEVAVLEEAVADLLQFSFHESLQVIAAWKLA